MNALQDCLDNALKLLSKKKSKKPKNDVVLDEQEPIDVVVDTIIGLLEHSTSFNRTVANQAFGLITSLCKESTIELILTVSHFLLQNAHRTGPEVLSQQLERRDPTADDDEDEEMGEIAEEYGEDGVESSDDEDDEVEESNESDDVNDEEDSESENDIEEFRKKVALAMNIKDDDDDSSDDGMNDDQMMAMDEQLAAVFKSRSAEVRKGKSVFSHLPFVICFLSMFGVVFQTLMPNERRLTSKTASSTLWMCSCEKSPQTNWSSNASTPLLKSSQPRVRMKGSYQTKQKASSVHGSPNQRMSRNRRTLQKQLKLCSLYTSTLGKFAHLNYWRL